MKNQSLLAFTDEAREVFLKRNALVAFIAQLLDLFVLLGTGIEFWYFITFPMMMNLLILTSKIRINLAVNLYFWTNVLVVIAYSILYRRLSIEFALIPISCLALFVFVNALYARLTSLLCLVAFVVYRVIESSMPFVADPAINYPMLSMIPIITTGVMLIFEIMLFIAIKEKQYGLYKDDYIDLKRKQEKQESMIDDQSKKISSMQSFSTDLQAVNKQLEFMLAQKTRELQTYLGSIEKSLCCILFGLDNSLIQINEYTANLYGQSVSSMLGKKFNKLFSLDQSKELYKEMLTTIAGGEQWRGNIKGTTFTNKLFYMDAIVTPIKDGNGSILYFLLLGLPFTEKKILELQKTETLIALEDIAFKTSHKIRGPIARIQGMLYLAKNNYLRKEELFKTSDALIGNLKELDQATSDLTQFVNNHYDRLNKIR
jgi:PAS domain S-box-containing protein